MDEVSLENTHRQAVIFGFVLLKRCCFVVFLNVLGRGVTRSKTHTKIGANSSLVTNAAHSRNEDELDCVTELKLPI